MRNTPIENSLSVQAWTCTNHVYIGKFFIPVTIYSGFYFNSIKESFLVMENWQECDTDNKKLAFILWD